MRIRDWHSDQEVLVIAEIGNNHEGNYALAEEMIGLAADAGADAVKFQTFKTEYYVSNKDTKRFNQLKSFELSHSELEKLSKLAREAGLLFISTPFDLDSAMFLDKLVDAFKISSGDNTFYPLIDKVAEANKPIIFSSGLADLKQINKTKDLIETKWNKNGINQQLTVMHCVSSYPVEPEYANLNAITTLLNNLDCAVGYSDHTMGIDAAIAAVVLGAKIIEKHFTIDKDFSEFRDHRLSSDPSELKLLVDKIRLVSTMLGTGEKVIQSPERNVCNQVKRSIVAKKELSKGTYLTMNDISWVRPAGGLPPGNEGKVVGKILKKDLHMGEKILERHLIDES